MRGNPEGSTPCGRTKKVETILYELEEIGYSAVHVQTTECVPLYCHVSDMQQTCCAPIAILHIQFLHVLTKSHWQGHVDVPEHLLP